MGEHKRGRRTYLNDFQRDADGKYRYHGAYYRYHGGDTERKRFTRTLWLYTALAVISLTAGALLMPADGIGRSLYVLLPLAAEIGTLGSAVYASGRLTAHGDPVRGYIYERTVKKLPNRCMASAVCAAIGAVATLVFLLVSGEGTLWRTAVYGASKLLVCALSLYLFRFVKQSEWDAQTETDVSA